jgi:hypothetical protein
MRVKIVIVVALLLVLAWKERKNKPILFGIISVFLFLGTGLTFDRLPHCAAEYLGFAGLASPLVCLGFAVKRSFFFCTIR